MEVFGHCRTCGKSFDAHWHNYPELQGAEAIMRPYCLYCKSYDVSTSTDESNDPPEGYESSEDIYLDDEE